GARASAIPIPGLSDVEYLTNENLFSLTELPPRFAIIGAGPIGCEMAQCFARFGSEVTLFEMQEHVLSREDADAALIVEESLRKDGINLMTNSSNIQIESAGNEKKILFQQAGEEKEIVVDQILVSVGRTPNVEGLNLEGVNVQYDARSGVQVDDKLRTTNKHIYAAGDICFPYKFTHTADFQARIVIGNTLFMGRSKTSRLTIPWCTYTDPEIAHVGLYEHQAKEKGYEIDTFVQPFSGVDRAILDGEEEGFAKVHVKKGTDQILGATIVAAHAGDLISEFTLAITNDIGLSGIGKTIHPYPTQADSIRKLGDAYSRTRLTPFVKKLFNFWLRITG
ncbi:Mercuric ion reductase, partial [hydrothermal vent metagenome]